jgi:hypothetical protein
MKRETITHLGGKVFELPQGLGRLVQEVDSAVQTHSDIHLGQLQLRHVHDLQKIPHI